MRTELKPFERGAEIDRNIPENTMKLMGIDIGPANTEVLFSQDEFDEAALHENFDIKTGEWYVEDGWVVGKNPKMNPGMIVSKNDYFGNIMLELTCKMVAPSTHDINVMIHGEWDDEKGRGHAYVAGLEAFWHGCIGFEKSPDYKLVAATHLLEFDPEAEYNFRLGCFNGKVFVAVNGVVGLEIKVPDPIDQNKYGKIGFEAFASWWKFKNVRVYRISGEFEGEYYNPEF